MVPLADPVPGPVPGPVLVGPLSCDDAGEVLTVQRAAYVTEAQRYGTPDLLPLRETLDALRADLARADVVGLGARLGSRLVGSVRGRLGAAPAGLLEVARLAVAPDVQGRGVGRALLTALHAAAPPSVHTTWLVTGARSGDNLRFYAAAGYVVVGAATEDAGVELVRMRRVRPRETVGGRS